MPKRNAVPDLTSAIEDYLASLSDEDWQALAARVRPPQTASSDPVGEDTASTPATEFGEFIRRQLEGDPQ